MTQARRDRKPAFASFVAIMMMAMVGMTLAALSTLLMADAQRTRRHRADAQLRQQLMAGAIAARRHVAAHGPGPARSALAVPTDGDGRASITIQVEPAGGDDRLTIRIEATYDERRAAQTLRLTQRSGQWHIVEARLAP